MLSHSQIDQLKQNGALLLPGFFSTQETTRWRREVEGHYGNPRTAAEWQRSVAYVRSSGFRLSDDPKPYTHPKMAAVYRDLHSDLEWCGENELVLRPPEPEIPWTGGPPHLDFPVAFPLRTLANITFYLSEIGPHGGAFLYWPGSHQVAWRHFQQHPRDYMARGERSQDQTFAIIRREVDSQPVAFTGGPGDVLIWSSLLLHSSSTNASESPRIAVIGRWGAALEKDELHYDFTNDPWAYWSFHPRPSTGREPNPGAVG